jgi:hypothetical protein
VVQVTAAEVTPVVVMMMMVMVVVVHCPLLRLELS